MQARRSLGSTLWAGIILSLIALLAIAVQTVAAQSQSPQEPKQEVQQLKDRLKQLEQTVQELKTQLAAIEQPRITPAAATPAAATPVPPAAPPPAESTTVTSTATPAATPATTSAKKQDKQGESSFQVYGMAMLDMGFDFKSNDPNWFDVVRPSKLPSFKDEFAPDGKVYFGVRQSRLGVKSSTATSLGELKTIFEFELFGSGVDAGQTTFRLRHAYGELGHFGAGQYWTVFSDTDVFPNSIEYWGPNGLVWFRNIQFRWMPLKGRNSLTLAIERPGASGDQGVLADRIELQGIRPKFDLPDLTGNVRFDRDWGHVQFAGIVRRIRWVDVLNDQFDLGGHATGWGTSLSSALKFGQRDVARLQVTYGEGIENYLNDAPVDVGIKRSDSTNPARPIKGTALPALGLSAFLDHSWSKRYSSAIGYSMVNIDNAEGQAPNAYHRGHYALTNLLYYPYENVMVGGEFLWGRRENFSDGFAANDYRIQFAFRYNFSKAFTF
jgi:hypothetical protein